MVYLFEVLLLAELVIGGACLLSDNASFIEFLLQYLELVS